MSVCTCTIAGMTVHCVYAFTLIPFMTLSHSLPRYIILYFSYLPPTKHSISMLYAYTKKNGLYCTESTLWPYKLQECYYPTWQKGSPRNVNKTRKTESFFFAFQMHLLLFYCIVNNVNGKTVCMHLNVKCTHNSSILSPFPCLFSRLLWLHDGVVQEYIIA